ncbi:MAG TPA: phosphoglycerate kinase [Gammaproteobacteria bacterium]
MPSRRFLTLSDFSLHGRRVLVRVDFNVPMQGGRVADDTRIRASLPTIRALLEAGATVILMSHLGRPKEGAADPSLSLAPIADHLHTLLGVRVTLFPEWGRQSDFRPGEVALLENVRFQKGEKSNDDDLARRYARLCDVFVNDAFATAHRAEASTHGVAKYSPASCAGPLLVAEVDALSRALESPARPMIAIVGGAKISTKLTVLDRLLEKVDGLIVGGGIANTFLKAAGRPIGKSLHEAELVDRARAMLATATAHGKQVPLPADVVCAKEFGENAEAETKPVQRVAADDLILDIGPETAEDYRKLIGKAATIVWNGPLGVFEFPQFEKGTRSVAEAIAESRAFSLAGGGETLAAIAKFGVTDRISYVSTGGGAFLEFLEGRELPAIAILEEGARARRAAENEY